MEGAPAHWAGAARCRSAAPAPGSGRPWGNGRPGRPGPGSDGRRRRGGGACGFGPACRRPRRRPRRRTVSEQPRPAVRLGSPAAWGHRCPERAAGRGDTGPALPIWPAEDAVEALPGRRSVLNGAPARPRARLGLGDGSEGGRCAAWLSRAEKVGPPSPDRARRSPLRGRPGPRCPPSVSGFSKQEGSLTRESLEGPTPSGKAGIKGSIQQYWRGIL